MTDTSKVILIKSTSVNTVDQQDRTSTAAARLASG